MEFDGQCIENVRFFFGNSLTDKGELFVFYKGQENEEEIIAQCDWQAGDLYCHPVEGYTCELRFQKYFSVFIHKKTKCVTSGDFRVDATYQQPIHCNSSDYRTGANDPITQTSSTTTDKETCKNQTDISVVAVPVAVIIGVLIAVNLAAVFIWRRKRITREEGPAKSAATQNYEDKDEQNEKFLNPKTFEKAENVADDERERCYKWFFRETGNQEIYKV